MKIVLSSSLRIMRLNLMDHKIVDMYTDAI